MSYLAEPWRAEDDEDRNMYRIYGADGQLLMEIGALMMDYDDMVEIARAVASLPDLLAVAEFVVEHANKSYPPELVMQAEAAVARARGEGDEP